MYARLFDWLIALVNNNLNWLSTGPGGFGFGAGQAGAGVVGLLDIFGFEVRPLPFSREAIFLEVYVL